MLRIRHQLGRMSTGLLWSEGRDSGNELRQTLGVADHAFFFGETFRKI